MKTSQLFTIEKFIVRPILWVLNVFVYILGKILRPDHTLTKEFTTIAIAKYKGMGSIIQSTPLLQTLRKRYPNAEIIFISTKGNEKILEKIENINTLILLDDKNFFTLLYSFFPFMFTLIRKRVDVYFDLEIYSDFSSLVTTASMAKNRIGFYLRSSDYRMGIYTHMMYYNINSPISLVYLQLARLLKIKDIKTNLQKLSAQQIFNISEQQDKTAVNQLKYFVINVNASDLRIERRWNKDSFIELIDKMQQQYPDYKLILIGNSLEQAYVENIISCLSFQDNIINYAGKTNIDELISLIEHASLVITNDTGPMHIAFSTQTKTVALFGPCSPKQYGHFQNTTIIYHQVYCSPCVHEFVIPPCKGNNQCMKYISVFEVLDGIENTLSGNAPLQDVVFQNIILQDKNFEDIPLGIVYKYPVAKIN